MFQTRINKVRPLLACLLITGACVLLGIGTYNVYKPLPEGLSFAGQVWPAEEISFYKDMTWVDGAGERHSQQEIFDKVLAMIAGANNLIVLDMFLFNDFMGKEVTPYRKLAKEVTDALVARKEKYPEIKIVVITDPINTVYAGMRNNYLERLESRNIDVVFTNLNRLRDSNPFYSSFWRTFIKPFGNGPGSLFPNPFGRGKVSLRSYLEMFNFKANHRKVIICDSGDGYSALVTSANPHDGSSAHGNVALYFEGPAALDLLQTENAILAFSDDTSLFARPLVNSKKSASDAETTIQILSENKIKVFLLSVLKKAGSGDELAMVAFYISDREVVSALKKAHNRGAALRILLDPNKDAFGREKNGIPNRQVAHELTREGIPVRWSNTHGEQSHAKMLLANYKGNKSIVILGSANFTRRNLNDLNLETNVAVNGPGEMSVIKEIREYFDLQWYNKDGKNFSVDYGDYQDSSVYRYMLYHWMERTGMSTF
jgi:phosphatidylserine/phosphatidylglycerophosphate/cardiolipin synthase-like enzyme